LSIAQELVTATTAYAPVPGSSPTIYSQNVYVSNMLAQLNKANAAIFSNLETTIDLSTLPLSIPSKKITLGRLCELGTREPDFAWPFFEALWTELTLPGRPPLMFTLDSLSYIMQNSLYRTSKFEPIHAMDLAIIKKFTDLLSGAKTLPNGGAIIGATSHSHAPVSLSLNLAIKQETDRQAGREVTKLDPFERKYDARADATMKGVELFKLGGLSKVEARGLMEYWAKSGVFRGVVNEKSVSEKWSVSGGGVVGEIERGTLKMRI
jgi:small subunit ribosomal protein S29